MPTPPRIGKFPQAVKTWTDGNNFNGYALIAYIPSTGGAGTYTEIDYSISSSAPEILPQFAIVPVIDGVYNPSVGLYFNADLQPPASTYTISFYDTTNRLISGPSAPFSVTADPISTIPSATLTAPTSGGTAPTPN